MKKITLFAILTLSITNLFSQTEQGKIIVDIFPPLSFISHELEWTDEKDTNFGVALQSGYFVMDKTALGVSFRYNNHSFGENKSSSFTAGPFIKYYLFKGNIKPFVQGQFSFGSQEFKDEDLDQKRTVSSWGLQGGVAFFFNEYISINASVGYNLGNLKEDSINDEEFYFNTFRSDLGFSLYF